MVQVKRPLLDDNRTRIGINIKNLRESAKLTQAELATRIDWSQPTIYRWERGMSAPNVEAIMAVCKFFNIKEEDLLRSPDITDSSVRHIEIIGELQAGAFSTDIEWDFDQRIVRPVPLDSDLKDTPLSGWVVRGDSMDQIYPDKSVVYIAPISNVKVRNGDVVMVIRRDVAGQREATLKEYVAEGGAV